MLPDNHLRHHAHGLDWAIVRRAEIPVACSCTVFFLERSPLDFPAVGQFVQGVMRCPLTPPNRLSDLSGRMEVRRI